MVISSLQRGPSECPRARHGLQMMLGQSLCCREQSLSSRCCSRKETMQIKKGGTLHHSTSSKYRSHRGHLDQAYRTGESIAVPKTWSGDIRLGVELPCAGYPGRVGPPDPGIDQGPLLQARVSGTPETRASTSCTKYAPGRHGHASPVSDGINPTGLPSSPQGSKLKLHRSRRSDPLQLWCHCNRGANPLRPCLGGARRILRAEWRY